MTSILVAGLGNIFHRDDAFGVVVAQELAHLSLPMGVRVQEFGIRGIDLAFALLDGYDVTILIDTTARGNAPGTLYTIEPDLGRLPVAHRPAMDSHELDPLAVLHAAQRMGAQLGRIVLVGCEPSDLDGSETGLMGLTDPVQAAVAPAVEIVLHLISSLAGNKQSEYQEEVSR
jgi:hydrogenase maturation protease